MKRSELNVGDELAWHRSLTRDEPKKVIVKAVEPHAYTPYGRKIERYTKGNGVFVEEIGHGGSRYERVVPLSQLRGPWVEYKAAYDAKKAREQAVYSDRKNRQEAADGRAAALQRRANALGITTAVGRSYHDDIEPQAHIDLDNFERLLALAENGYFK